MPTYITKEYFWPSPQCDQVCFSKTGTLYGSRGIVLSLTSDSSRENRTLLHESIKHKLNCLFGILDDTFNAKLGCPVFCLVTVWNREINAKKIYYIFIIIFLISNALCLHFLRYLRCCTKHLNIHP